MSIAGIKTGIKQQAHNVSHYTKSRKLGVVMFWQTAFTLLLWFGKITELIYRDLSIFILSAYLVANVAQKSKLMQDMTSSNKAGSPMGSGD